MTDRAPSAPMRRALDLARQGWGQTAPNPMVGAVLVRDGRVAGEGFHAKYGNAHAESVALAAAGDQARGATLYVTLEPCAHQGHTPPCADAIVQAGVARVVMATRDPNPDATGGLDHLRGAGVAVEVGDGEREARELNAAFYHRFAHPERPYVILKFATSRDEAIAGADRTTSTRLTGPESNREVHRLRAGMDAIAVGISTVLGDDPQLTVRHVAPPRVQPTRVVFATRSALPVHTILAQTARDVPTIFVTREPDPDNARALERLGVRVIRVESLAAGLRALAEAGIHSMLLEGGAHLAASFLTAGLVDRMIIFQAPVELGAGALGAFSQLPPDDVARLHRLPVLDRRTLGDDVMTTYALGAD